MTKPDDFLTDDVNGMYLVSAGRWPKRSAAARALIEHEVGDAESWLGILRIARDLDGPTELRAHLPGESEGCACEGDDWFCAAATGDSAGLWWVWDGAYCGLEDAAWLGGVA